MASRTARVPVKYEIGEKLNGVVPVCVAQSPSDANPGVDRVVGF